MTEWMMKLKNYDRFECSQQLCRLLFAFVCFLSVLTIDAFLSGANSSLEAKPIKNKVAVFAALNKITARISHLEVPLNSEVEFGALTIIPRVCNTRPPTEPPSTTSFIEVQETKLDGSKRKLFTGWVFAENPGVHAVEHPVFDVWLTSCKTPEAEVVTASPKKLQRRRTRVKSRRR